jgi:hypothetical protein
MKNAIFWDVIRRFEGNYRLHHQSEENNSLMMEAKPCSETLVLTRATWPHIPHIRCRGNIRPYIHINSQVR